MRNTMLSLFVCVMTICCAAQDSKTLSAKIVDSKTLVPLENVHLEFVGTIVGTTTNAKGVFHLNYPQAKLGERFQLKISSLGYEPRIVEYNRFRRLNDTSISIPLDRKAYDLGEVFIKSPPRVKKIIGHSEFTAASMGYWEGDAALGGEIASVIEIKDEKTKLHNLSFRILQNSSDSLKVRVHFYEYDGGVPERKLVTEEIIHTISRQEGIETIPLTHYTIFADDDILVSIELLEAYGPRIYFSLSASAYGGLSFIREPNHPYWIVQKTVCVGFKIESSIPAKLNSKAISAGE